MLNNKFVVQVLEGPDQANIESAVRAGEGGLKYVKDKFLSQEIELGNYAIVMDAADCNLHQIFNQERPDINSIRTILQQVFEAVEHLHEKSLMHGDLKLLNIIRFRLDNRLRLIDRDAAATTSDFGAKHYTCAKFSSATLPPELWSLVDKEGVQKLEEYWKDCDSELKAKVDPLEGNQVFYVVKSFRSDDDGNPISHGLPYDLVEASGAIDSWALGVIAFLLLTGESFVPSTRDNDCASGEAAALLHACGIQLDKVEAQMRKVKNPAGRDLISKLLQGNTSKRLLVDEEALKRIFFNPKTRDADVKLALKKMVESQAKNEQTWRPSQDRKRHYRAEKLGQGDAGAGPALRGGVAQGCF